MASREGPWPCPWLCPWPWLWTVLLLAACGCTSARDAGVAADGDLASRIDASADARAPRLPASHLGQVTGEASLRAVRYTCSRAGVFAGGAGDGALRAVWQPPFRVLDISAAEQGPWLLACGGDPARSGVLAVVSPAGAEVARAELSPDLLYAVAASPDGELAATGGADGKVWILALPRLDERRVCHAHGKPCRAVAFSPDAAWLASGGRDGLLLVSPVAANAAPLAIRDHVAGVEEVAFTPAGTIVSRALDGRWREHDKGGRQLRSWVE